MKLEFKKYLKSIGLTDPLVERVEIAYKFYTDVCKKEIQDIFVCEYVNQEGRREYESLWFFADSGCMECHQFVSIDRYDFAHLDYGVLRWVLSKENYNFEKAIETSRLAVEFTFGTALAGRMNGSGSNCDQLMSIFTKYIAPKCGKFCDS